MAPGFDLLCLSHARWGAADAWVQHLMRQCAAECRVLFVEPPMLTLAPHYLEINETGDISVLVPHVPQRASEDEQVTEQQRMLKGLLEVRQIQRYVLWYCAPRLLTLIDDLRPLAVVYACVDVPPDDGVDPPNPPDGEEQLLQVTDLVFAASLRRYDAQRLRHPHVHLVPGDSFGAPPEAPSTRREPADGGWAPWDMVWAEVRVLLERVVNARLLARGDYDPRGQDGPLPGAD